MGDKTQVVTVVLAARFYEFFLVVAGTTRGIMLANAPVNYLAHKFADRLPTTAVHVVGAMIFGSGEAFHSEPRFIRTLIRCSNRALRLPGSQMPGE